MDDQRTAADHDAAAAILDAAHDGDRLVSLVLAYYRDADRADRTPRATLYLHLGMVAGAYMLATRGT